MGSPTRRSFSLSGCREGRQGIGQAVERLYGQGDAMIRQAISCDICGTEKKQTNHWFVAHDQGGELRVSGWSSRNRLRPGTKHLCGQTCLHKLVDEFMARTLAGRVQQPPAEEAKHGEQTPGIDASLTSDAAYQDFESSARLIETPAPVSAARAPLRMPELVPAASKAVVSEDEPPRYTSRNWRAEAWQRERERELHGADRPSEISARRRSN
jgi:hypothetical protein